MPLDALFRWQGVFAELKSKHVKNVKVAMSLVARLNAHLKWQVISYTRKKGFTYSETSYK